MAFCTTCGWKFDGTPKFCQQCGTPLAADGSGAAAPAGSGGVAAAGQAVVDSAMSMAGAAHPEGPQVWQSEEHDLWTGKTIDLATGGDWSPNRYRLTTRSLYYSQGRLGSVEKSVPLWAVTTVALEQSLLDKVRHGGVGTLILEVKHPNWQEETKEVRIEDIDNPNEVRDLVMKQMREEQNNYERRQQTMFYQGRPIVPPR
jgi:hypothetical protein